MLYTGIKLFHIASKLQNLVTVLRLNLFILFLSFVCMWVVVVLVGMDLTA